VARLARNATAWYWWLIANRWFGFWLDALCCALTAATALAAVFMKQHVEPGLIGLALVYVLALSGLFQYMMRQSALVETYMTSVERLSHYANQLESEEESLAKALPPDSPGALLPPASSAAFVAAAATGQSGPGAGADSSVSLRVRSRERSSSFEKPPSAAGLWPREGALRLEGLRVRYREDLPEVLKGITADLTGFKKVGVVGRTGSGKSSLLLALARLNQVCGGRVLLDGVDTAALPLATLRTAVAVIPQEPHLFSGTVRFNLDPFGAYSDAAVWAALDATQLRGLVADLPGQLQGRVAEGGSTWSAGQRQLLSLARALLHRRQLVLLDEATASVDHASDQRIQRMLRTDQAFAGATLVVIAHRIDTVLDSDVVLVLEKGQLAEMGPPQALIAKGGAFAAMVAASKNAMGEKRGRPAKELEVLG
jgi:ABC-type multidrug transport system fused ATPase/permease subunit